MIKYLLIAYFLSIFVPFMHVRLIARQSSDMFWGTQCRIYKPH